MLKLKDFSGFQKNALKVVVVTVLAVIANVFVGRVIRDLAIYGPEHDFVVMTFVIVGFFGPAFVVLGLAQPVVKTLVTSKRMIETVFEPRDYLFGPLPRVVFAALYCAMIICAGLVKWQNSILPPVVEVIRSIDWVEIRSAIDPRISVASATENPDACHRGYLYLVGPNGLTRQADQQLRLSDQGQLIADLVTPEVVASSLVVEHMEVDAFNSATTEAEKIRLICLVLAEYSRLREGAYQTTMSLKGYYGRIQMAPAIYEKLRRKYPTIQLTSGWKKGIEQPLNSALAAYALYYDTFACLPRAVQSRMKTDEWRYRATMVGYKTGYGKVSNAIEDCGVNWRSETGCRSRLDPVARQYLEMGLLVRKVFGLEAKRDEPTT